MNEPLQRVSQDNGVFDGALIGAAIAAGGAGAGVFGTAMHYNGIDNRVKREQKNLQNQLKTDEYRTNLMEKRFDKAVGKQGPRFYEKPGYNRGNRAEAQIAERGTRKKDMINDSRHRDIENLMSRTGNEIDDVSSNLDKRYSGSREGILQHNRGIQDMRNEYVRQATELNSHYDDQIRQVGDRTAQNLNGNKHVQYRNKVDGRIQDRVGKKHGKLQDALNQEMTTASKLREVSSPGYGDTVRSKHAYSKMGGWKNAAIIGASAVVGGGLGMIADGISN